MAKRRLKNNFLNFKDNDPWSKTRTEIIANTKSEIKPINTSAGIAEKNLDMALR